MNGKPRSLRFEPARWLPAAALFGAALLAYLPALRCGFVWNDADYVTAPALRSLHGLSLIWFKLGATQQYYPLLHTAFWVEHRLWGDSAMGYHLVNILLHAGSATLIWIILRRLSIPGAWLAALVFVVHPVCAESVAWISEEKNTLSTLFYLAAALTYLRFDEKRRRTGYCLAFGFFVLALLCKTVAATLPGALLVVLWWRRGRLEWRRDFAPLVPWMAAGTASGLASAWIERVYVGASGSDFALSGLQRLLVAGRALWFYLGKLFWPAGLNFIYARWNVNAAAAGQYLYPAAAVALTLGLWLARRRSRAPLAAWLFFAGSLFPTLGFLNVFAFIFSYVADHWQYLASIGVFTLVAAAVAAALSRAPAPARRPLQALVAAVLGVLAVMTWRECGTFRDPKTFYSAILERNPDAFMAQNNLGIELQHEGRIDAAIEHFREALRIRPDYAEGHTNLGLALCATGRTEEGISHYRAAIQSEPGNAVIHDDLGVALARLGRVPEAIEQYETASRLNPDYVDPVLNLGFEYFRLHRLPEAIASYERALRLRPDNAKAENDLGLVLAEAGRTDDAVAHYQKALRANPDFAEAHCNLGAAFGTTGRYDLAEKEFELALKIDDRLPDAHYNLGVILAAEHRFQDAIVQFEAAVRLQPDSADAELQWGAALQSLGRPDEARIHLDKGARLQAKPQAPQGP
jgi:tetratricopeptide (TPR) repeat protein